MLHAIKSAIPVRWKRETLRLGSSFLPPADFPSTGPRLIVALAADYANLGDVAITRALVRFGALHLASHRPYLLCAGKIFRNLRGVARASSEDDVISIVGGGNMGDRYPDLEEARSHVVRHFPRNRIVSFPQTFDFSDTTAGQRALASSRLTYSAHPRLCLFAREKESFRRMQAAFPECNVQLAPDIVLSEGVPLSITRDIGVLVCLRQDLESRFDTPRRLAILDALRSVSHDTLFTDTVVPGPRLNFSDYEQQLDSLLACFARARCVVTDRLHGLIFSVINRTPCVVIENNNHKIRSTWDTWLSGLTSVRLLANPEPASVAAAVHELGSLPAPAVSLNGAFTSLARALSE